MEWFEPWKMKKRDAFPSERTARRRAWCGGAVRGCVKPWVWPGRPREKQVVEV